MPALLTDPPATLWILLLIFALVAVGLWLRSRSRTTGLIALVAVAALVGVFLLDRFVESPREEATRRMRAIIAAFNARKFDDGFAHLADDFDFRGLKAAEFRKSDAWRLLQSAPNVTLAAGGLSEGDSEYPDGNTVIIGFTGWATVDGKDIPAVYARATYKKQAAGEWKMRTMELYESVISKNNGPKATVPGLPPPR